MCDGNVIHHDVEFPGPRCEAIPHLHKTCFRPLRSEEGFTLQEAHGTTFAETTVGSCNSIISMHAIKIADRNILNSNSTS